MKKWTLMIGMVIGAMVFGLAAFAAAPYMAQAQAGATATATTVPSTSNVTPAPGTTAVAPNGGDRQGDLPGQQESDLMISAAAGVTGLTAQDVTTQLQAGQSLGQIAQSKGKTAADVIQSARATLSTLLQQAVSAGTITHAQADAELAEYDQRAPQMAANAGLNNNQGRGFGAHGRGGPEGEDALVSAASSVTGLTAQEVMTQLQAGQSLAQIAQSKGKTADDIVKAARAVLSTQLQQAVTASNITQAQADAELAQFDQKALQIVNDTTLGQEAGEHGGPWGGPNRENNPANPTPTGPTGNNTTNS